MEELRPPPTTTKGPRSSSDSRPITDTTTSDRDLEYPKPGTPVEHSTNPSGEGPPTYRPHHRRIPPFRTITRWTGPLNGGSDEDSVLQWRSHRRRTQVPFSSYCTQGSNQLTPDRDTNPPHVPHLPLHSFFHVSGPRGPTLKVTHEPLPVLVRELTVQTSSRTVGPFGRPTGTRPTTGTGHGSPESHLDRNTSRRSSRHLHESPGRHPASDLKNTLWSLGGRDRKVPTHRPSRFPPGTNRGTV